MKKLLIHVLWLVLMSGSLPGKAQTRLEIGDSEASKGGTKYYQLVIPNQEEIRVIERERKVRVRAYFAAGPTLLSGLPITETRSSLLDLGLEMGGGFYLDFNRKVGLFADVTGGAIGKYIFLVGPLSVSSSAGILINTSKTSGIYLGGNFYRQVGYNRLAEQSINATFLSIETGYKSFQGNDDNGPISVFMRYGSNVEQPRWKLLSVGFRMNMYTGKN